MVFKVVSVLSEIGGRVQEGTFNKMFITCSKRPIVGVGGIAHKIKKKGGMQTSVKSYKDWVLKRLEQPHFFLKLFEIVCWSLQIGH